MYTHIKQLSGDTILPLAGNQLISSRYWNDPGNSLAGTFLLQVFQEYGWSVTGYSFGTKGMNIVASKNGVLRPFTKVVFGAHYDSMPAGISPGADDNATGVAVILEFARITSEMSFPYSIELVLFDEEEWGLLGSYDYVNRISVNDTIIAMINLDMLGWDGNHDKKVNIHTGNQEYSGALATVAQQCLDYLPTLQYSIVTNSPYPSDHFPFIQNNLPAIALTEDYENDMSTHWHATTDTYNTIDTTYFNATAKWSIATVLTLLLGPMPYSLYDNTSAVYLSVWPNPTESDATVAIQLKEPLSIKLSVYNAGGSLIHTLFRGNLKAGFHTFNIPENAYILPGIYMIHCDVTSQKSGKNNRYSVKMVKEK